MRPEEVVSIFDDDDVAVRAALQEILAEAKVSKFERVSSTIQSLLEWVRRCFSGGPTPEPIPLRLLPPPAAEPSEQVAEPHERVRTWREWFSQLYDDMRRAAECFCDYMRRAAEGLCARVSSAVRTAVNFFVELLPTFLQQLQRQVESELLYVESLFPILERIVTALLGIQTAFDNHAHHH
ncbi:unnamed protein product [Sphagnum jensenii]|uniref:Uncharacterized protein n=1 Tax=Sphagnum jensenii TaxID=128206 RepID=A0ABP0VXM0_9BRYO